MSLRGLRGLRVLVTGADQHQGLAVIRGLGRAGVVVTAAGAARDSLGFHSRYAAATVTYRSPSGDPAGCVADVLAALEARPVDLVMPAVESTLVALTGAREAVEAQAPLAVASDAALRFALDKWDGLTLGRRLGLSVPASAVGASVEEVLDQACLLPPPFVIKPRGHGGSDGLPQHLDFKVRYAADLDALRRALEPLRRHIGACLVQAYVRGVGRCVAGVWRCGRPMALVAYEREREFPVTGGVSVVRRSIPLEAPLVQATEDLLGAIGWHGVAMVEFKYHPSRGYTLMEINGRFPASTALCMDAGVDLPGLACAVHLDRFPLLVPPRRRTGVVERWLRGDLMALGDVLDRRRERGPLPYPSAWTAGWRFVRDFARARRYDEWCRDDWVPGVIEALALAGRVGRRAAQLIGGLVRAARGRRNDHPQRRPRVDVAAQRVGVARGINPRLDKSVRGL